RRLPQKAKTLELKPDSKVYSSTLEKKKEKPVFLTQLSGAAVNTGETTRFTVRVSGFPKPTVQWSHNGKVVKSSSVYKLIEEKDEYTLVITQVTSEYEGKYSCQPASFTLQIQPVSHTKFECEIEEAPDVAFKWYKSGTEIRQSEKYRIVSRHTSSSLELLNPVKADSGEYTCKASNQHGTDSCTASLIVTGKIPKGPRLNYPAVLFGSISLLRSKMLPCHIDH
uniref:Ig-like domain-containing protein n=1 Tax=Neolamprologus brichardi TaxID=32507 RepID=A0A3Q4HEJ3_NEOBR